LTGELEHLAELIRAKNEADLSIARLPGRPTLPGKIGEFVAARVFNIELMIPQLQQLGIKIGVATSVRKQHWEASRIYPARQGSPLDLTDDQIAGLKG
jgi:hypothetical protein